MSRLIAKHLTKTYNKRTVVKDVSIDVNSGQIVGILGPNGAGKTTSFYMVVGLIRADGGQIFLDDIDLSYKPMHERAKTGIGYLPQEASIFRKLSVTDNILAILQTRTDLDKNGKTTELERLLKEFHITNIRNSLGISLSGGERRRVEIARALASNPKFILLDEPFAGVDPIAVNDIRSIIAHLKSLNIGVLITDHNVRETISVCEYLYIVGEGKILTEGTVENILNNEIVRKVYLGEDFKY